MYHFTADLHFDHYNIINFCDRPYHSAQEMNVALIEAWNAVVEDDDIVYVAGDIFLGKSVQRLSDFTSSLNGYIHILPGSHDHRWVKEYKAQRRNVAWWSLMSKSSGVVDVRPPMVEIYPWGKKKRSRSITVCHYAMRTWPRSHYDTWHVYGHSHGRLVPYKNALDVGVDNAAKLLGEYRPFNLEEVAHFLPGG